MRRQALEDVGPFDERFFMYVEDLEWCWRAHRHGWEVYFDTTAIVRHIGNVSGARRFGDRRAAAYLANTYRFYRDEHGATGAALYKWLNVAGVVRNYAGARLARDDELARYWRQLLPAYMGRAVPATPGDG
jgi:GT2 family glycosyltransferase